MKGFGAFAVVLAVLAGMAATPAVAQDAAIRWQQSPIIFLPGKIEVGEREFVESETIVEFPLRWAFSTRLAQEVALRHEAETFTFEAGSLLPKVQIGGSGRYAARTAFCTRSRIAEHREGVGLSGLMFGNWLNSLQDKQICLEDGDKDGSLDRAIMLGDGEGIAELGPIDPLTYQELYAEPLGTADDVARVSLLRVGRTVVQIQFDIIQRGHMRDFATMRSGRFNASRFSEVRFGEGDPGSMLLFGVRLEVLNADRRENRASLRWSATASPEEFVVVPDNVQSYYSW